MFDNAIYNAPDSFDMILKHPQVYVVMEFTGLKDKNGVETYDSFIVKQFDDICLIERCIGGFDCKMITGPHKGSTFIFSYLSEGYCEIIGNKWENPELLMATE